MKSLIKISVYALCFIFISKAAFAMGPNDKRFGAGIYAGDPTGLTLKGYITQRLAIQGVASWSFVDKGFAITGDAIYDFFDLQINSSAFEAPVYIGAGAKVVLDNNNTSNNQNSAGIRIPVGIALHFNRLPIEVNFEVAPGLEVTPKTELDFSGGIGARYYF